jgi:dethiobiotin synthetase
MRRLPQNIFVTGIGTGVGKTIASAVLTEALQADYWKPIQCGNLEDSDSKTVQSLISNSTSKIHAEAYRLKTAASPHYAALVEKKEIELKECKLPVTENRLVIEGAGGIMVPLNQKELVLDLIIKLKTPVILVVRNYLGAINHTLLTIDALGQNGIELLGVIFSGDGFLDNEEIIRHFGKVQVLGIIDEAKNIDKDFIKQQSLNLKNSLSKHFTI